MRRLVLIALGSLLWVTAASAKPAGGPLCFHDSLWGAHWMLDTAQVGTRHWTVAGEVNYGAGYAVSVFGSGTTGAVVSILGYALIGGGQVPFILNLNSEAQWWPATLHVYGFYPTAEGEVYAYYWPTTVTREPCH